MGFSALAARGFKEAAQDAVVFQALGGAGALDDAAHDDDGPQAALGLVVGRRDAGAAEAGEEEFLFLAQKALTKVFGPWVAQRGLADLFELLAQAALFGLGGPGPPRPLGKLAVNLAGPADEPLDVLAELPGGGIGRAALEQGQFLVQFFGLGLDVGQAGLAVPGVEAVVGSISVGHQHAPEVFAQEFLGSFGGAVRVPAEASQVVIAGIPNPEVVAVVAPGSFVGMSDGQGANLVEQVGVEGQAAAHGLALETKGAGRHKLQAEEVGEELADFAVGNLELVAQIDRRGFGCRADV